MALENVTITACANSTPPAGTKVAVFSTSASERIQAVALTDTAGNLTGAAAASPLFVAGSAVVTNQVSASVSNTLTVGNALSASISNMAGSAAGSPLFVLQTNNTGSAAGSPTFTSITNVASVVVSSGSVVVTNSVSASISNIASVVVSSGSVVVTNALSASLSGGSIALLAGANVIGVASAIQGTPAAIGAAWPVKLTDGTDTVGINAASQLLVAVSSASVSIVDTSGNQYGISAASPLYITGGAAGGTSATDKAAFAEGTTTYTPTGGMFFDTAASLTACQAGVVRQTAHRALHVNVRDASGNQLGVTGSPLVTSTSITAASVVVTNSVSASISNLTGSALGSPTFVSVTNLAGSAAGSPLFFVQTNNTGSAAGSPTFVSTTNVASVIVSSGSVVVTNIQSASVSNFPTLADKATFAEGTTVGTPIMALMLNTTACLTASQVGVPRMSEWRAQYMTIRTASGNELGAAIASPLFAAITNQAGSAAGSPWFVSTTNMVGSAAGSPQFVNVTNMVGSAAGSPQFVSVTNQVSASISNVASVIVSSGSVVVINALSASLSGGSVALLAGANVVGSASVIQSTPTGIANAWPTYLATNTGSVLGMSMSPLAVAMDVDRIYVNGSLVSLSTLNLSGSTSGCTRIVASTAGQAILILAATFTTSSSQNIGWVASGAGAASALVQSPMPFGTNGGMDANRMPHGTLWEFPSGSNAILTATSACIIAGNILYTKIAS